MKTGCFDFPIAIEFNRVYELHAENQKLLADLEAARVEVKKAEDAGQAYYDQGFDEATESLKSQLGKECKSCFLQGWDSALDQVGVDDGSDLCNKGWTLQPYKVAPTVESEEGLVENNEGQQNQDDVRVEDVNDD